MLLSNLRSLKHLPIPLKTLLQSSVLSSQQCDPLTNRSKSKLNLLHNEVPIPPPSLDHPLDQCR